jgi:hypothetical protein
MRIVKHRPASVPFECSHCGIIRYEGHSSTNYGLDEVLCISCHLALDTFMHQYEENNQQLFSLEEGTHIYDEHSKRLFTAQASAWVADPTRKPHPDPPEKRFHRNVPKWMRNAITADMVPTTNRATHREPEHEERMYIISTENDVATRVELINKYDLKSIPGMPVYRFTKVITCTAEEPTHE